MKTTKKAFAVLLIFAITLTSIFTGCESMIAKKAPKEEPSITFGKEIISKGITFSQNKNDDIFNGTVGGKEYSKFKKKTVLNFKIDERFLKRFNGKNVFIKLSYYDESSQDFSFSYYNDKGLQEKECRMSGGSVWSGITLPIKKIKLDKDKDFHFSISLENSIFMMLGAVSICEDTTKEKSSYPSLFNTKYSSSNGKVITANVLDYGAVGDGVADDTAAFQTALREMNNKGGVLYVPTGKYRITQNLLVFSGVTLLGDFNAPSRNDPKACGTIIAADIPTVQDGNNELFIKVAGGGCVKGLTVWYPNQSIENGEPKEYPYTIGTVQAIGSSIEDIYLVNSYNGITNAYFDNFGNPTYHYQQMVKNIYGTPLSMGYMAGHASDSDRQQFFDFSPAFWLGSGLENLPDQTALKDWLINNATGFSLGDIDFHYVSDINIEGYKHGMHIRSLYGRVTNFKITDCHIPMYITDIHVNGGQLSNGILKAKGGNGYPVGLHIADGATDDFSATNLDIESAGNFGILYEGQGAMALQDSKIKVTGQGTQASPVYLRNGFSIINNSELIGGEYSIKAERMISSADIINCTFTNYRNDKFLNKTKNAFTVIDNDENVACPLSKEKLDEANSNRQYQTKRAAKQKLYSIGDYGVKPSFDAPVDISDAVQNAINDAYSNGGGIVYISAGDYRLDKPITVKSGVELQGSNDYFHYVVENLNYTILLTNYGKNAPTAAPLITIELNEGIRGLSVVYDKVAFENELKPAYATTIQAKGKNTYVINTTVVGGYYIADFNTYKCDNHYIESLNFYTFKTGIAMGGGSKNGVLLNGHSNPGEMWSTGYNKNIIGGDERISTWNSEFFQYSYNNVTSFYYGKTKNQSAFMTATFGAKHGIHIDDGADVVIMGHGTDLSQNGIRITVDKILNNVCTKAIDVADARKDINPKSINEFNP